MNWTKLLCAIMACGLSASQAQNTQGGTVHAWGSNVTGELGNGTFVNTSSPVDVSGLNGVTKIAGGYGFTVAVKSDGTIWAWGGNQYGLGDEVTYKTAVPVKVPCGGDPVNCSVNITNAVAVAAGYSHALVVTLDGAVWGWGFNIGGQLGDGGTGDEPLAVQAVGLTNVRTVAAGSIHSLALKNDGTVWAWGSNGIGQLGTGTNLNSYVPVPIPSLSNVVAIAAGAYYSLAVKQDGTVWAWGDGIDGTLGNGTNLNSNVPIQVPNLTGVVDVAAGTGHSMALKSDGTVWVWGVGEDGRLGNGANISSNVPVRASGLTNVVKIAAGFTHCLALKADGTVWSWGLDSFGQLGDGTFGGSRNVPAMVANVNGAVALATGPGPFHSVVITAPVTPFAATHPKLNIFVGPQPGFDLTESFALGAGSDGVNPVVEPVTLQVGSYVVRIPAQSFKLNPNGKSYAFDGVINGVTLAVKISSSGPLDFVAKVSATGINLSGTPNPTTVVLSIGDDSGTAAAYH